MPDEKVEVEKPSAGIGRICCTLLGLLIFILAIIVIVLAVLYSKGHNCASTEPTMHKFASFSSMKVDPTLKYLPVAYSSLNGTSMEGGLMEITQGVKYSYVQWNEGFLYVLDGSFKVITGSGSKTTVAGIGDALYIKRGTNVELQGVAATSRAYWVCQTRGQEISFELNGWKAANPTIGAYEKRIQDKMGKIAKFANDFKSESFLVDLLESNVVKGKELAAGLYELRKGPALDYTYEYEEFKYIISGEFHLTDGTGKKVVAKEGDLMYFPKGTFVKFTSPDKALGFYVGQREADTA